jgi:hypothetical protein
VDEAVVAALLGKAKTQNSFHAALRAYWKTRES